MTQPSFIEDPTPVIKVLKDYVGRATPTARWPRSSARPPSARRRSPRPASACAAYPAPVAAQFEAMLEAAQAGLITEDHNFWIDFYGVDAARQIVMEVGRRLTAAGAIDPADRRLLADLDEMRDGAGRAGRRPPRARRRAPRRARAPRRRRGARRPGHDARRPAAGRPAARFTAKFGGAPPAPSDGRRRGRGSAGSAGKVRGVARVVRSLQDAERLQPGEILVAETTAPPWTPLFAVAAAVVTDTGGVLSHCAVVAREYGIPAVVGAGGATKVIADGDVVEVDGDAGTVRIV